jgi:tRNA-Thr(GGU) m(6)t(6)A37 methyltransferase TsaA
MHADVAHSLDDPGIRIMITLRPIGRVRSPLVEPSDAPKQGFEGAPDAWLEFAPEVEAGLRDLRAGEDVLILTWLDRADRETLLVHPRDDPAAPLRGVFSTRSADRPNPVGLHRVRIAEIVTPTRVRVLDLEAVDGTPILDVKPVLQLGRREGADEYPDRVPTSAGGAPVRWRRLLTLGYRVALAGAGVAVLGGIADVLVPRLLPHHEQFLGVGPGTAPPATARLVLLLLHALGAALTALGVATLALLVLWRRSASRATGWAAAGVFALGEAANAAAIYRAGSALFVGPLACVAAVILGVAVGEHARRREVPGTADGARRPDSVA